MTLTLNYPAGQYIYGSVTGSNGIGFNLQLTTPGTVPNVGNVSTALFVKKGMKFTITMISENIQGAARFIPLV